MESGVDHGLGLPTSGISATGKKFLDLRFLEETLRERGWRRFKKGTLYYADYIANPHS